MKICNWYKIATENMPAPSLFSSCCFAKDQLINATTPFAGMYSDLGICPSCKMGCEFVPEASLSDMQNEIGDIE